MKDYGLVINQLGRVYEAYTSSMESVTVFVPRKFIGREL